MRFRKRIAIAGAALVVVVTLTAAQCSTNRPCLTNGQTDCRTCAPTATIC